MYFRELTNHSKCFEDINRPVFWALLTYIAAYHRRSENNELFELLEARATTATDRYELHEGENI